MTERTDPERSPGAWLRRPRVQRACGHCGATFALPTAASRYCSPACRQHVGLARRAKIRVADRERKRASRRGGD